MKKATEWPNKLGYDVDSAEVFLHANQFRVFTTDRVMLVPYAITRDPVVAVAICEQHGLLRDELEYGMDYRDAMSAFLTNLPTQIILPLVGGAL